MQRHWKKREKKSARVEVENFAEDVCWLWGWGAPSGSESIESWDHGTDRLRVPPKDEDHPGNDPFCCWFSQFFFQNVPSMAQECARIYGLKIIPSDSDRATKMRHSFLLNSWVCFSVPLPSMPSEACVMHSSFPGTDVFVDWLFLGNSFCVSLATAANFRLFLNVVIFSKGKVLNSSEDCIILYF